MQHITMYLLCVHVYILITSIECDHTAKCKYQEVGSDIGDSHKVQQLYHCIRFYNGSYSAKYCPWLLHTTINIRRDS